MSQLPQPQAIRAAFFDVGFTLLAPHPSVAEIVREACTRRGIALASEDLERQLPHAEAHLRRTTKAQPWTWGDEEAIAGIWTGYFAELLRPCLPSAPPAELAELVESVRLTFDHAASYALYPDVLPALGALRARDLIMGVISDWGIGLGLILRHHDLIRYFDFAVISAAQRRAKPDPALFQTALRRADAIPDYAIHVGDSYPLDVLGARAAGITPILLDRRGALDPAALDCLVARDLYGVLDLLEVPRPTAP